MAEDAECLPHLLPCGGTRVKSQCEAAFTPGPASSSTGKAARTSSVGGVCSLRTFRDFILLSDTRLPKLYHVGKSLVLLESYKYTRGPMREIHARGWGEGRCH